MGDDTTAALVIQLTAETRAFRQQMKDVTGFFDKNAREIERRQSRLRKQLEETFNFGHQTGLDKVKGALMGITAVGVVGGLGELVNKSLEAASSIGETAIQAGVSTKKLQELRFAASQSGASFEAMDGALITFNKNFGEFLNTGGGKTAAAFKSLGIDKMIKSGEITNTEQAFDAYIAKVQGISTASQRSAYLANAFGKEAGPKLAEMVGQGAAGLAALQRQANQLGLVLDDATIASSKEAKDKLDALFATIKMQGTAAFARLAPDIAELSQQLIEGMPRLINYAERWADFFGVIRMSPFEKLKGEIMDLDDEIAHKEEQRKNGGWKTMWGVGNGLLDNDIADLKRKKSEKQSQLDVAPQGKPVHISTDAMRDAGLLPGGGLKINDPESAAKTAEAAKKAAEEAKKVQDFIDQTGADAKTAAAAVKVAEAGALADRLRGQNGYYAAILKQIDTEKDARLAALNAEEQKEMQALLRLKASRAQMSAARNNISAEYTSKRQSVLIETTQKIDDAGPTGWLAQIGNDRNQSVQQYQDQIALIGMSGAALAREEFMQQALNSAREKGFDVTGDDYAQLTASADAVAALAQQWQDMSDRQRESVEVADGFRSMVAGIAVNFHSARSAAAGFLNMLSQMVASKGVEALFGKQGTSLGGGGSAPASGAGGGSAAVGVLQQFIASIPGFAGGTNSAPGGVSLVGERGPELVNLPRGAQVVPNFRMPSLEGMGGMGARSTILNNSSNIIVHGNADNSVLRMVQLMFDQDKKERSSWLASEMAKRDRTR